MSNRKRISRKRRVSIDGTQYQFDPAALLYGIGSGRTRSAAGEDAERVVAAILLNDMRGSKMGRMLAGLSVDELIESAQNLVRAGFCTEPGLKLPSEFN